MNPYQKHKRSKAKNKTHAKKYSKGTSGFMLSTASLTCEAKPSNINWKGVGMIALLGTAACLPGLSVPFLGLAAMSMIHKASCDELDETFYANPSETREHVVTHDASHDQPSPCRQQVRAQNIPSHLALYAKNGKLFAKRNSDASRFQAFFDQNEYLELESDLERVRGKAVKNEKWYVKNLIANAKIMRSKITNEKQAASFHRIIKQLEPFIAFKFSAQSALEANLGNCEEQAAIAFIELFNHPNPPKNIQLIVVSTNKPDHNIDTHVYLLKNNQAGDIEIFQNMQEVNAYLKRINPEAEVCDGWHNGYVGSLTADKSGLYNNKGGIWNGLRAETLPIDFAEIATLPPEAQKFVCGILFDIATYLAPEACESFRNAQP